MMMFVYVGYDVTNCTFQHCLQPVETTAKKILRSILNGIFLFRRCDKFLTQWIIYIIIVFLSSNELTFLEGLVSSTV